MEPILYVCGDVHYCGERNAFIPWLQQLTERQPARLVILGDLFEYWLDTELSMQRSMPCLQALWRLKELGWQVDLIPGNREIGAGAYLKTATKADMHWPDMQFNLGSKRLRIVHGEFMCGGDSQRLLDVQMRSFWWQVIRGVAPGWVQEYLAKFFRDNSRSKGRYRFDQNGRLRWFDCRKVVATAHGFDVLLAGHVHQKARLPVGKGAEFFVVGDWSPGYGSWVEGYADGRLQAVEQHFTEAKE